jgi:signal transduction histidine kinase
VILTAHDSSAASLPGTARPTRLPGARLLRRRDRGAGSAVAASGRTAVAAAAEAVEAQQRFLAYAAHELRTPLATQRALLELALADPDADAACWREIGGDVLRACRQQERVLDACLTLARSRSGSRRREPVDLAAVAAGTLRAHEPGGLERVVVLEPAWTRGDPDLLAQLAANLVSNAIRYNVDGGRVEVATGTGSGRARLGVANTGPPIPAGELRRLFQPFQRLAPRGPDTAGGVGLGLAIVRAIADVHGAVVTARARAGGGLGIDVAFPALD